MPKKKKGGGPSKKSQAAAKKRILEDKTFGMKNKKGGKAQKYMQQVKAQLNNRGKNPRDRARDQADQYGAKGRKAAKEKEDALLNSLFKQVKGDAAKKAKNKALLEKQKADKLAKGVKKKKKKKKKKGQLPAAPPKPPKDTRPIEVQIEEKRSKLYADGGANLTPVTAVTFAAWKKKMVAKRKKAEAAARKKYEKETGRKLNRTGKDLYAVNSKHFVEEAGAGGVYKVKSLLEASDDDDDEEREQTTSGATECKEVASTASTNSTAATATADAASARTAMPPLPPTGNEATSVAELAASVDADLYLNEDMDDLDDLDDLSDEEEE